MPRLLRWGGECHRGGRYSPLEGRAHEVKSEVTSYLEACLGGRDLLYLPFVPSVECLNYERYCHDFVGPHHRSTRWCSPPHALVGQAEGAIMTALSCHPQHVTVAVSSLGDSTCPSLAQQTSRAGYACPSSLAPSPVRAGIALPRADLLAGTARSSMGKGCGVRHLRLPGHEVKVIPPQPVWAPGVRRCYGGCRTQACRSVSESRPTD